MRPDLRIVECDCTCADACPQGRTGIASKCRINKRQALSGAKSTIVERGPYRAIVGEHPEQVYLAVGNGTGATAMFADPVAALEIAAALIEGASKALEFQFRKRMGSP